MRGSGGCKDHELGARLRDHLAGVGEQCTGREAEIAGRPGAGLLLHIRRTGDFQAQIAQHLQMPQTHASKACDCCFHSPLPSLR